MSHDNVKVNNRKIIIAIDGLSACGKSTLARGLASRMNYRHIDSGSMYRAVTYFFLIHNIDLGNGADVEDCLSQFHIHFESEGNKSQLYLGGQPLDKQLRSQKVDSMVSQVAAIPQVRRKLVLLQQEMGEVKGLVMDGRDIGSVVFPDAELKIFLTADLDVRTRRRMKEIIQNTDLLDFETVRENLVMRDHIDSTRDDSPLIKTADAVVLDNSNLSPPEQLEMCLALAQIRCD